jgi:uncharacterized Tic20 family protein
MNSDRVRSSPSVDRRRGTWIIASSAVIAGLVTVASVLGLVADWPYRQETENWVLQARGQDIGNLFAVILLVASAVLMRTGSSAAAQLWTGAQFYLLYAYIVYAFAVHFGSLFLVYVAVVGLVSYTLIAALASGQRHPVSPGRARRFAAWVLIGTGALFALLWLSELVPATVSGRAPASLELAGLIVNPIHVIDLSVVLPGMIAVGVLALRGRARGLGLLAPALIFSVLMGSSIIAAILLIMASGDSSALAPLAMVAVVVLASLGAAIGVLRRSGGARPGAGAGVRLMDKEA